jgi:hypothetical protein
MKEKWNFEKENEKIEKTLTWNIHVGQKMEGFYKMELFIINTTYI